jgi:hypothetical protein
MSILLSRSRVHQSSSISPTRLRHACVLLCAVYLSEWMEVLEALCSSFGGCLCDPLRAPGLGMPLMKFSTGFSWCTAAALNEQREIQREMYIYRERYEKCMGKAVVGPSIWMWCRSKIYRDW